MNLPIPLHDNPFAAEAMRLNDIQPGTRFVVMRKDPEHGHFDRAEAGEFVDAPEDYSEEGWFGATAVINGIKRSVDLTHIGVVPDKSDGLWVEAYTLVLPDQN